MSSYVPLAVVDVELEHGLAELEQHAAGESDVYAVFRWRGLPLGARELTRTQLASRATLASLVAETIEPAVRSRLDLDGGVLAVAAPLATLPPPNVGAAPVAGDVSVVIATRRRPEQLARALESLRGLATAPAEIIVVDNDPDEATRAAVVASGIAEYVAEPRPGLSAARNAGIRRARGAIVAFTDDDAVVDADWLDRLCAGFDDPAVSAVTGLVLPSRLDSPAQIFFERELGWLRRGFEERSFGRAFFSGTRRVGAPVWLLGAGVNLAVRRGAFARVGLFDERLGAGASGCSEDSELLYRILAEGGECRYRPDAVVRHEHRAELDVLEGQVHDYVRGHVSALFVQFARYRDAGNLRRALLAMPWSFLRRLVDGSLGDDPLRRRLFAAEVRGYLDGLRYARWAVQPPRSDE